MTKFLVIASLLFLSGCGLSKLKLIKSGSVSEGDFYQSVSYENMGALIILNVDVNGVPARFLFDTGAPNVISPELTTKLALKTATSTKITDSGGNKGEQDVVVLDSVNVAGVNFYKTAAIVQDLRSNSALACMNIDGIIGANLMKLAYWEIDFEEKQMKLSNDISKLSDTIGMTILPFTPKMTGTPEVDIHLNGTLIKNMTFDTGSNGDITVPQSEVKKIPVSSKEKPSVAIFGSSSYGVYGLAPSDTSYNRKIDSLNIGGNLALTNKIINFRGDAKLIGMKLFENYKVILDWKSNQIYFKEVKPYFNDEFKSFGFGFTIDKNQMSVGSIVINSDAQSKLKIGDRILRMNYDEFDIADDAFFCQFFYNDVFNKRYGDKITLKIKRGEEIFEVEVEKVLLLD